MSKVTVTKEDFRSALKKCRSMVAINRDGSKDCEGLFGNCVMAYVIGDYVVVRPVPEWKYVVQESGHILDDNGQKIARAFDVLVFGDDKRIENEILNMLPMDVELIGGED